MPGGEKVGLDPPMEIHLRDGGLTPTWSRSFPTRLERETSLKWRQSRGAARSSITRPSPRHLRQLFDGYRSTDDAIIEVKFLAPYRKQRRIFAGILCADHVCRRLCTATSKLTPCCSVVGQKASSGADRNYEHELLFRPGLCRPELMRRAELFLESMRTHHSRRSPSSADHPAREMADRRHLYARGHQLGRRSAGSPDLVYGETAESRHHAYDESSKQGRHKAAGAR